MTRDRNRKKAVRAAAAVTDHGSYQRTLHDNPHLRGPNPRRVVTPPPGLDTRPALGTLADGTPYRTGHNLHIRDADTAIAILSAAAAYADSLQSLTVMLFDLRMQFVDVADVLTGHGFTVGYACDPRGCKDLLDDLRAAITHRRDEARAQGIRAMVTEGAPNTPRLVVIGPPHNLTVGECADDITSPINTQVTYWAVADDDPGSDITTGWPNLSLTDQSLTLTASSGPVTLNAVTLHSLTDLLTGRHSGSAPVMTLSEALQARGIDINAPGALRKQWNSAENDSQLSFPIGEIRARNLSSDTLGTVETVILDDPAFRDHDEPRAVGTHGVIQGITGAGKSHLIDAWVNSIAALYSPERVMFLLARDRDVTQPIADLPHIAGTFIEHGHNDATSLERFLTQIQGELARREATLAAVGATDHREYLRMRSTDTPSENTIPALPSLILVWELDAFGFRWSPVLVDVCRRGRALGVHVIIGAQGTIGEDLSQHMSFFVSLATHDERTSVEAIGIPDAAHIKAPNAFIRYPSATATEGALVPFVAFRENSLPPAAQRDLLDTARPLHIETTPLQPTTLADAVPTIPRITDIDDPTFRIGDIDDAFAHARLPLSVTTTGANAHLAVLGNTGSGKTTTLATIIGSAGVSHDASLASFYVIDPTGAGLATVANLHNVGAYASATDVDLMERLIGEAVRLISHRENSMTRSRSGDFAAYFTSRGDARPEDPYGHFYLVVDRIDALFARYPRFEQPIRQILAAGGAVGVHIIASATSLRYTLESSFAKIYLTCNADDLLISDRDHRDAVKSIPSGRPGRTIALDAPWHPACVFTSDAGELPTPKTVGASKAPSVWPVADRLPADALPSPAPGRIAIGLNRHTGLPANLPWPTDLIVAGAGRSGRSNIVRMIINHIAESQTAEQLRVFIADPKLTLRQEARELRSAGFLDPATGYAYDRSSAHSMIDTITEHFNSSHTSTHYSVLDEPDRSAVRTGPHVLVLIDDYSRFTDDSFTLKSEFDRLSEHLGPRTGGLSVIVTITDREWTSFKDSYAALPAAMMNQQTPLLALSGSPANTVRPTIGEDEAVKFTSRRAGTCMLMQPPSGCAELPVVQTPIHPPAAERAASTSSQPRT